MAEYPVYRPTSLTPTPEDLEKAADLVRTVGRDPSTVRLDRLWRDIQFALSPFRYGDGFNRSGKPTKELEKIRADARRLEISLRSYPSGDIVRGRVEQRFSGSTADLDAESPPVRPSLGAMLKAVIEEVDAVIADPSWDARIEHPYQTLVGYDLPKVARRHLRIQDTFTQTGGEASGEVITFILAVLDAFEVSGTRNTGTIGQYVANERALARDRLKNRTRKSSERI